MNDATVRNTIEWQAWMHRWNQHHIASTKPKTIEVRYVENGRVVRTRTVPADITFIGGNHGRG